MAASAAMCLLAVPSAVAADGLTAEQKVRADRLISVFENDTPDIQYGYVEILGDGRGFTAGRGFTTASGDVRDAVRLYTDKVPDNPLRRYQPRLDQLAADQSGDTAGLDGFASAWAVAGSDPTFRSVQDALNDRDSYDPALALASQIGVRTALGQVILYDTVFTHGLGADGDPDGTLALVDRTRARAGGLPASGVDERAWLGTFLAVRNDDMRNARNATTRTVWADAADRLDVLGALLAAGNLDFSGPLVLTGNHTATIP